MDFFKDLPPTCALWLAPLGPGDGPVLFRPTPELRDPSGWAEVCPWVQRKELVVDRTQAASRSPGICLAQPESSRHTRWGGGQASRWVRKEAQPRREKGASKEPGGGAGTLRSPVRAPCHALYVSSLSGLTTAPRGGAAVVPVRGCGNRGSGDVAKVTASRPQGQVLAQAALVPTCVSFPPSVSRRAFSGLVLPGQEALPRGFLEG